MIRWQIRGQIKFNDKILVPFPIRILEQRTSVRSTIFVIILVLIIRTMYRYDPNNRHATINGFTTGIFQFAIFLVPFCANQVETTDQNSIAFLITEKTQSKLKSTKRNYFAHRTSMQLNKSRPNLKKVSSSWSQFIFILLVVFQIQLLFYKPIQEGFVEYQW